MGQVKYQRQQLRHRDIGICCGILSEAAGILVGFVCLLNVLVHGFLSSLLVLHVQAGMYSKATGINVVGTVEHVGQLTANVLTEPRSLVVPHIVGRGVDSGVVKVYPKVIIGLSCFLWGQVSRLYHFLQHVLLTSHGTVGIIKGIVVGGV